MTVTQVDSRRATTRMTAKIVPFPAARRIGSIRKMAQLMLSYRPDAAERALKVRLEAMRSAMLRRGLPSDVVDRELRSMELAIRARLWAIVMQGDDVA